MRLVRIVAGLTAVLAAALALPASASTLTLLGQSKKVCQLTGQTDWFSGHPTNALTTSRYGLIGIDLGFPVEGEKDQLYFLFGDANPNNHPPGAYPTVPPDDGLGVTMRTAEPNAADCLDLNFFSPGPGQLTHPVVTPAIQQGSFNVPTGGVFSGGRLYAFFWTNHCLLPDPVAPNAVTPLLRPTPPVGGFCPETDASNSIGRSVLAYSTPADPTAFKQVAPPVAVAYIPQMPSGFVYVSAADPPDQLIKQPAGPPIMGPAPDIPVFGVARYRAGIPYLAMAPRATFGAFKTWHFYGGTGPNGPIWLTYAQWQAGHIGNQWAPPPGAELYADSPNPYSLTGDERCVGEHSVTWSEALGVWLMTYTCGGLQVEARTAPKPWGPWSKPTILLSAVQNPGLYCTLFWNLPGQPCPGRVSQEPPALTFGYLYAPFVLTRYTKAEPGPSGPPAKAASVFWLLSTWDPYQVTVMHSTLEITP